MRGKLCLLGALVMLSAGGLWSCGGGKGAATTQEVVAVRSATVPVDPEDAAWQKAPVHRAELLLQDLVEPRLMVPSTRTVEVQALTDGRRIAFRIAWEDPTRDDLPGAARFSDACAVQLPRETGADLPAPQMGETGRTVEITYWRASWQAWVDGREDDIRSIYPNATVDHYPFEAPAKGLDEATRSEMARRYAPARALGNVMEGPRERPVEDFVAEGPGTLTRVEGVASEGRGMRTPTGWVVVIQRPLPRALLGVDRARVAFAVWQGSHDEVGARKMRTGWIPLSLGGTS
jgi:hypothetical protein